MAAVLVIGLVTTVVATQTAAVRDRERRQGFLDGQAQESRRQIERRVANYVEVLHGLRNVFALHSSPLLGHGPLSPSEFAAFVDFPRLARRYPGTLGVSFSRAVPATEVTGFEAEVRARPNGNARFEVYPGGGADPHVVVDYVEPEQVNFAALGFDLTTDPARRHAVEDARDTGSAIATAPIRLVQDSDEQPDVLLMMAVYDTVDMPQTTAARRRHFRGVVAIALRAGDFLGAVLKPDRSGESPDLEVFDVGPIVERGDVLLDEGNLIFDSHAGLDAPQPIRHAFTDLDLGTRRWRVVTSAFPGGGGAPGSWAPWATGVGGTLLTLMAAALILSATRSRYRAERLADSMTADLQEHTEALAQAHKDLGRRAAELARSNTELERFAYAASHDLQEPLRMISSCVSRLAEADGLDDRARRYVAFAVEGAERMGALIDDLLAYSHSGNVELRLRPVSLKEMAERLRVTLASTFEQTGARLDVEDDLPTVMGDAALLGQVMQNLVTNGCKFHRPGQSPHLRISGSRRGGEWQICVDDNGIGIDPRHRARVFEAFRRLNRAADYPGTGIGLALCAQIVERHGGRIWVEDSPLGGSRVVFTLPVQA